MYSFAQANRPGLISDNATNSRISPYCSTRRRPQKEVPRTPVPTSNTLNFLFTPKASVGSGMFMPAANMLRFFRKFLREVFSIVFKIDDMVIKFRIPFLYNRLHKI